MARLHEMVQEQGTASKQPFTYRKTNPISAYHTAASRRPNNNYVGSARSNISGILNFVRSNAGNKDSKPYTRDRNARFTMNKEVKA